MHEFAKVAQDRSPAPRGSCERMDATCERRASASRPLCHIQPPGAAHRDCPRPFRSACVFPGAARVLPLPRRALFDARSLHRRCTDSRRDPLRIA